MPAAVNAALILKKSRLFIAMVISLLNQTQCLYFDNSFHSLSY